MTTTRCTNDADDASIAPDRDHNLGHLRLRHQETNEIILIPAPSDDPNDPLNWYDLVNSVAQKDD